MTQQYRQMDGQLACYYASQADGHGCRTGHRRGRTFISQCGLDLGPLLQLLTGRSEPCKPVAQLL